MRRPRPSRKATDRLPPSGGSLALADPASLSDLPLPLLEFQSPTAAVIATPVSIVSRYTMLLVTALVATLIAVAAVVRIPKVVSAPGRLVSTASNVLLQPFDTSIVQAIDVHEGEIVHKGEILAKLNPTFASANLRALSAEVIQLAARRDRLAAEAGGTTYAPAHPNAAQRLQAAIFQSRKAERIYTIENYDQKIAELRMIIAKSDSEAGFYRKQVGVAKDVEHMRDQLQRMQVGSKLNSLLARNDRLTVSSSLSSALATAAAGERDLAAQKAERDAYEKKWIADVGEKLAETDSKLIATEQDLAKARLQSQLVVMRAPRDAIVLTVAHVSVGSVLRSGAKFITLVPLDAPLEVEADISGAESGHVHVGDPVTVKFATFDYLRYGTARGTLRSVSADSFSSDQPPAEGASPLPNRPRGLYYKARISIDRLMLHGVPPSFRLTPGMPLTADIKTGRRTILSYFMTKLLPVATDSMREP